MVCSQNMFYFLAVLAVAARQPRSIDTLVAERRAVLTSSLESGTWMRMEDMVNKSLVGVSRANAMRRQPLTAADRYTIDFDGGPHFTGHDLVAALGDLIGDGRDSALRYMEIGVAQGRNVYGALHVLRPEWSATAFSFERINPPFEEKLRRMAGGQPQVQVLAQWNTSDRALFRGMLREVAERDAGNFLLSKGRKSKGHPMGFKEEDPVTNPGFFPYAVTRYGALRTRSGASKAFTYIHADEYDKNAWKAVAEMSARDGPWQMVLSDAEHTEAVVQYECDRYESSKVVDFTRWFAVLWDDEMMSTYCTKKLQRLSPKPLAFGAVKVMGRTGTHVWQFAASLPMLATRFLADQMCTHRVAHHLVHSNGKDSTCCVDDPALTPPKRPPTALLGLD
mmetsp:Transcript_18219/g.59596  ORF Transcript_18219/g.59596 Transcript_18219/m.59596 type:complete len:393 (-) Transcript_18219:108-1286(-)